MSKVELLKYLLSSNLSVSWTEIGIALLFSIVLSVFLYFVYKKTYSGVMYSKSFNSSLVITAIITTVVMLIIGSNLALSLGMVGSLSIIRFRTAIKDPKDMTYMFWAIGIGLSCGANMYFLGILGSIVIAVFMFVFSKGINNSTTYLLICSTCCENDTEKINNILNSLLKNYRLKIKTVSDERTDITYEINLAKCNENVLISKIKSETQVNQIKVISYDGEISG